MLPWRLTQYGIPLTADIVIWITRIPVAVAREGPTGKGERYRAAGNK